MSPLRAGYRVLDVSDAVQGVKIPVRVLYPTDAAERRERLGPYEMDVAPDAAITGTRLPLAVISHGGRATALTYRGMARALTHAGFVVAMPEHIGDCRSDSSLSGKAVNLENRPRHLRLTIDACLADAFVGPHIDSQRIGLIGHSMGGYTALALTGGKPSAGPHETDDGTVRTVAASTDPRIRAVVLMTPGCAWYGEPGSLAGIRVPMLLLIGEKDEHARYLHPEYIARDCDPALIDQRVIADAGHHAFQSPFPPRMCRPDFPPSWDPPGFDREAFQPVLYEAVLSYLRRQLDRPAAGTTTSAHLDGSPAHP
jgi:predicted dienelactone hydrolase